ALATARRRARGPRCGVRVTAAHAQPAPGVDGRPRLGLDPRHGESVRRGRQRAARLRGGAPDVARHARRAVLARALPGRPRQPRGLGRGRRPGTRRPLPRGGRAAADAVRGAGAPALHGASSAPARGARRHGAHGRHGGGACRRRARGDRARPRARRGDADPAGQPRAGHRGARAHPATPRAPAPV
ncbi:MAG: hypothetical protein AVDCRST_MAG11-688, partial [uncultured Gemmatimonadaceae bacterium]